MTTVARDLLGSIVRRPVATRCTLARRSFTIQLARGDRSTATLRALLVPPGLALIAGSFGCAQILDIDDLPTYPAEAGATKDSAAPKEDAPAERDARHASDVAIDGASSDGGAPTHEADGAGEQVLSFGLQDTATGYDWDVGENHFTGDQYLRIYPYVAMNAYQDFRFTSVPGIANGWTICNVAVSLCLSDGGGEVVLVASGDTWVTTAAGTIQNHVSKRYIEVPTATPMNLQIVTTGTVPARWAFLPPH
jgi:hypothetical protein